MLLWNTDMAWCGGSGNQEIPRRCSSSWRSSFRSIRSTIAEYELFLILFFSRKGPLDFLVVIGGILRRFNVSELRGLSNGRLVVVFDGQYVVSDERNVSFAAAIGFKMKILPFVAYEVSFT